MNKKFFFILISFIFITTTKALYAAPPSVALRVDVNPKKAYIGDVITYSLTIVYSSGITPSPLLLPDPMNEFELLDKSQSKPQSVSSDKNQLVHTIALTTFSTGTQTIPSLSIHFLTSEGKEVEAKTETVDIVIKSLLEEKGDKGNICDLKGLFGFRSYFWIWMIVILLCTAVIGYYVFKSIQLKRQRDKLKQGPPRPPEDIFWETITRLENSDLIPTGNIREFYFQLSFALRLYLENRYGFSALDKTTSELLVEFRRCQLDNQLTVALRDFFENGDLVKFAKYIPLEDQVSADLNAAKKVVTITTPVKELKPEEKIPV